MPEDLLQQLEALGPATGNLENIEDLVRVVAREVSMAVQAAKGSALMFENAWRRIVMDVARGESTKIQAVRSRLLSAFDKRLSLLTSVRELAIWLHNLGRENIPDANEIKTEIAGMEGLKASVFDNWQTREDLEDLAARDYPLTTVDLEKIGPKLRPPASYYAEESKPF